MIPPHTGMFGITFSISWYTFYDSPLISKKSKVAVWFWEHKKSPTCNPSFSIRNFLLGTGGAKFCMRTTKQPISHRGPWGAQTGPGTLGRQLITIIMNYNQPWTTLGLAPQPQRGNRDPNGSQGSANFHCIMVPGSPWSARRSPLRLQSAILTSTSDARDFVGGPKLRGSVSGSKTWTQLSRRVHQVMHLFTPGGGE